MAASRSFTGPAGSFLFNEMGPRILTAALLPTGIACEEGAAATADARVRLIFGSGVRESVSGDAGGITVLGNGTLGVDEAAARAAGMFETSVGDVLAIQDIDPDNVVDVCIKLSAEGAEAGSGTITMTCAEGPDGGPDFIVRDPEGQACEMQEVDLDVSGFMAAEPDMPTGSYGDSLEGSGAYGGK